MKSRSMLRAATGFAAASLLVTSSAGATADVTAERLLGADRYGTAAAIAAADHDDMHVVFIASGENFPDALAGSYLAGVLEHPVLLTERDSLPQATADRIVALGAAGAIILGGVAAVSADVETELADLGLEVERLEGADRYATAAAIATQLPPEAVGELSSAGNAAILASGAGFADALAAGPIAGAMSLPLLLTAPDRVPAATLDAFDELDIREILLVGGTAAVSAEVEADLLDEGFAVRRVFGANRVATAAALADFAVDALGFSVAHANLARGGDFPDALAGAVHAALERAPILLTGVDGGLGDETAEFLAEHAATLASIDVFGGTAAISDATVDDALEAAGAA